MEIHDPTEIDRARVKLGMHSACRCFIAPRTFTPTDSPFPFSLSPL